MPDAASRFLEQMPEPAGLLLLDTQNRPVAWIPMDASEMTKLRTGDSATGAARIMRALERSNASNLMIKLPSDSEAAIENIQKFTNAANVNRSEEHTSELQSLMRISYAVFCLKKK